MAFAPNSSNERRLCLRRLDETGEGSLEDAVAVAAWGVSDWGVSDELQQAVSLAL
jgi:hypothetical protein